MAKLCSQQFNFHCYLILIKVAFLHSNIDAASKEWRGLLCLCYWSVYLHLSCVLIYVVTFLFTAAYPTILLRFSVTFLVRCVGCYVCMYWPCSAVFILGKENI